MSPSPMGNCKECKGEVYMTVKPCTTKKIIECPLCHSEAFTKSRLRYIIENLQERLGVID